MFISFAACVSSNISCISTKYLWDSRDIKRVWRNKSVKRHKYFFISLQYHELNVNDPLSKIQYTCCVQTDIFILSKCGSFRTKSPEGRVSVPWQSSKNFQFPLVLGFRHHLSLIKLNSNILDSIVASFIKTTNLKWLFCFAGEGASAVAMATAVSTPQENENRLWSFA